MINRPRPNTGLNKAATTLGVIRAVIVIPLLFCFGIGVIWAAWSEWHLATASQTWPTAQATITSSGISESHDDDGTTYHPEVEYRFTVKGKEYTNSKISATGLSSSHESEVQQIIDQYPEGSTQTVHYNPADPSTAILQAGLAKGDNEPMILGGVGVFLLFLSVALFLYALLNLSRGKGFSIGRGIG